jgi:uncharacterized protein YoxC
MYRIIIFIIVIALLYACTTEINSAVEKTGDVTSGAVETLKEKVGDLLDDTGETVEEVKGESEKKNLESENTDSDDSSWWEALLDRKDNAVEKFEDTKEKYLELKEDLDNKYEDLQKAIQEVEEAKEAIDKLLESEEDNPSANE